jgi:hypothetical protein
VWFNPCFTVLLTEQPTGHSLMTDRAQQQTKPKRPSSTLVRRVIKGLEQAVGSDEVTPEQLAYLAHTTPTPWLLQQFLDGMIDLESELIERYPNLPLMSVIKTRALAQGHTHQVATLTAPDDSATLTFDIDPVANLAELTFALSGLFSMCFSLDRPDTIDRPRWLEIMERRQAGLTFLWGATRWEGDYLVWIVRRYQTNLYAFSPHGMTASIRMTPDVTRDLLAWLRKLWAR